MFTPSLMEDNSDLILFEEKDMKQDAIERGYADLAEAIVAQAGIDYLKIKKELEDLQPCRKRNNLIAELESIERFFKSEWFKDLTDVSPNWLVGQLDKAYAAMKATGQLKLIDELKTRGV